MKYWILAFCLLTAGCGKGAYVTTADFVVSDVKTTALKYECRVSRSIFLIDRTVAICDTEKECREICLNYGERE